MGMDSAGLSVADALALQRDGNNDGMFGGNGSWVFFLFFLLAWGGGNGFGGWGNNTANGALTRAEMQQGFDNQSVMNELNGLEQGLCNGFYAQNTTMLNGFNGVQRDLCNGFAGINANITQARFDNQQCCCKTNRNIDAVRYENAKNTCDIVNAIKADGDATRALMTQNEIQKLRDDLQTANFQLSQQAQSANIVSQLRPTPTPAYLTCSPYESNFYATRGFYGDRGCGCC